MGYPTTIQLIQRKTVKQTQWYVNFPNVLAQAMGFAKGETIEWEVENINSLRLLRTERMQRVSTRNKKKRQEKNKWYDAK